MRKRRTILRIEPLEGRALTAGMAPGVRSASRLVARDIAYTAPGELDVKRLDLYLPRGEPPEGGWPVVLAIHGGGWRKFSKEQYAPKVVPALTRDGFAVVAPNYALASPGRPAWPTNFQQLRQAVIWVKDHAAEWKLDPTRIGAIGESAGGHLAALLGTNPAPGQDDPARIGAVVSFSGPTDLAALAGTSSAGYLAARLMIGTYAPFAPAAFAAASPTANASPGDAPALILQGTRDTIVPPQQAREFSAALTAAGVANRLVLIPGAGHDLGLNPRGRNLIPLITSFLRDALNLPARASRRGR